MREIGDYVDPPRTWLDDPGPVRRAARRPTKGRRLMANLIDLGLDHTMSYVGWRPDRELNPQYAGIPDIERVGIIVRHLKPDGSECSGYVQFDLPDVNRALPGRKQKWTVVQQEPLTLAPSIQCTDCGDHGFIKEGRWTLQ